MDKQGMTALHMAALHNEAEIVQMLIKAGANIRCCDGNMATPLHYAAMEGSVVVAKMLFEAGNKIEGSKTIRQVIKDWALVLLIVQYLKKELH